MSFTNDGHLGGDDDEGYSGVFSVVESNASMNPNSSTATQLPTPQPMLSTFRSSNIEGSQAIAVSDTFGRYSTVSTPSTAMDSPPIAIASSSSPGAESLPAFVEGRRPKAGILRLDMNKPRRSSGGSAEFRTQPQMLGEDPFPTGLTSPHQLSVTWAESCDIIESDLKLKPMQECAEDGELTRTANERTNVPEERHSHYSTGSVELENCESPALRNHLNDEYYNSQRNSINESNNDKDDDDEEDYSVSVSAIMQRRASIRGYRTKRGSRCSRRASSPMDQMLDSMETRRRSSVYTSSSDEGTNQESTQEQIFENIRLHKEVIQSVKFQPWPIRKKLKLVRQAKTYVARHEGALQERFAMSRSTKDLFARFKILMAARWRHWKRETSSFLTVLIPWELRIKEIESHFGSGVASYFTFLRWLMWVNIMMAIPLVAFVIGPEYFATKHDETDPRKKMSEHEYKVAGNLFTIWEFEGYLKYSPMFYGYYSSTSGASSLGYKLPLAYFLTAVVVYIYSFVATLRKMAENSRNSKLSSKDDECTFSWKLFTGWDFMIGHAETAHNRIASVVVGFKEALLEEAEKKKDKRNWRIIMQRILVNLIVTGLLAASGYTVVLLVNKSEELARLDNWFSRNAVNVTMTLLSFFLPMIFEALGLFENWHPRQQLRLQLARIMILNMLNLYSLMFSFIYKINSKEKPLQALKIKNETATMEMHSLTSLINSMNTTLDFSNSLGLLAPQTTSLSKMLLSDDVGNHIIDKINSTSETISSTVTAAVTSAIGRLKCYNITVKCSKPSRISRAPTLATTMLLLMNLTTTTLPPSTEPISTITTTSPELLTTKPTPRSGNAATNDEFWNTGTPHTTTPVDNVLTTLASVTTSTTAENITENGYTAESTTQQTNTTSLSTKDSSFFDYYDYFAGMAFQLDSEGDTKKLPTNISERTGPLSEELFKSPIKVNERKESNLKELKKLIKRHVTAEQIKRIQRELTISKIDKELKTKSVTEPTEDDAGAGAANPTEEPTDLWVHNAQLPEVVAYFTTSTSTNFPPSTILTSSKQTTIYETTTTTEPATENYTTLNYEGSSSSTTPYFIDDDVIEDVGEASIHEADEVNEVMGNCVRTICEEVLPTDMYTSSTVEMDSTTDLATTLLTPLESYQQRLTQVKTLLSEVQKNLTSMCWETSLGQELSKVIVFDGFMGILAPFCIDFLRALFVRYLNRHWCWDMEKTFPQYGDFKIAENILTLIYNQGQVWMGIFFSPGLVLINLLKLIIMMYFRSWIVLTCNVPHEVVFKASKSNNFYLTLLLTMLFLCVLPVSYAIVWLRPSWHCGPFSDYNRIAEFITNATRNALPKQLHEPLDYLTSASTVIPLLLLLILIIYYLISLTGALREANQDLRTQLLKEREEERRKMFKVPESKPTERQAVTLTSRWRKVLEASSPVTPTSQAPDFENEEYKNQARKELISRIMKKALRKSSATSDEDSVVRYGRDDDDTDTEHNDSLPHDEEGKEKVFGLSKLQQIRRTRKPSLIDIVQIAKSERERERKTSMTITASKESNSKGRFKVEKHEHKEKDKVDTVEESHKDKATPPIDNAHDPDVNSRIVNERRESLLRRKREDDDRKRKEIELAPKELEEKFRDESTKKKHRLKLKLLIDPSSRTEHSLTAHGSPSRSSDAESKFLVINEKQPTHEQPSPKDNIDKPKTLHNSMKLKFMKPRIWLPSSAVSSNGEGIFQFDENSLKKRAHKTGKPEIPSISATEYLPNETQTPSTSIKKVSPPRRAHSFKQVNAEKFASLSRQGRKKIGSFVQLMREAAKKFELEKLQQEQENGARTTSEPTTPIPIPTCSTSPVTPTVSTTSTNDVDDSNHNIAISKSSNKKTTETVSQKPNANNENNTPKSAVCEVTTLTSKPKHASFEALEVLDQTAPVTSPQTSTSQRRRKSAERLTADRANLPASSWLNNIPTITISATGSDESIAEPEKLTPTKQVKITKTMKTEISSTVEATPILPKKSASTAPTSPSPSSSPKVNIIKVNIEDR